ncbi:MAG: hypothetical protein ABSG00_13720 [Terracidiphilus sp.]|jgi:hypothetical protein
MSFSLPRSLSGLLFFALAALPALAQNTPPAQPHQGTVIFSRSTGEDGQTVTQSALPAVQPAIQSDAASSVTDAERKAVTFTAFDLDVHLHPAEGQIAVRAQITVRNDGSSPLSRLPLQISSSLNWERIRILAPGGAGKDIAFHVAKINSDADHTGQLNEASVSLAQPLEPGQTIQLDVGYSGLIALTAQRLQSAGAPSDLALHSDWDQISVPFTGLRGFGDVVWYPVASLPALLGDGARLFDEIGEHKLRLSGARFRLRLAVEFPHGQAPTVALINGHSVPLSVTESGPLDQSQEVDGVAIADSGATTLGFQAPSLFAAIRTAHSGPNLTAWTLPDDNVSIQAWIVAASAVTPFLQGWLGQKPRSELTLLDLPDPKDAPFETGSLLAAPLSDINSQTALKAGSDPMENILVHALTHAWITTLNASQTPEWLNEGLATFVGALWVEKKLGRDAALRTLEADRTALALAEPASPGQSSGQPLAQAVSPVYYRTKAAYVLWMLRDQVGDEALAAALRGYNPAAADPGSHPSFERLLEERPSHPDLAWFFTDWIDADKGLPDVSLEGVFPTTASAGYWLVAVSLANNGYAAAEVPVTVRSASASVTRRVRIPARGKVTERILIEGKPTEAQVNDGSVPETQASVHITRLDSAAAAPLSSSQPDAPK